MFVRGATQSEARGDTFPDIVRPLCLGASVGHPHGASGCIGGFVVAGSAKAILSSATALCPKTASPGDFVHQPGPVDNPLFTGESRVARLPGPAAIGRSTKLAIDAAYAELLESIPVDGNVVPDHAPGAGYPLLAPSRPLEPGDRVAKIGRGSMITIGRVVLVDADVTLHEVERTRTWSAERADVTGVIVVRGEDGRFSGPGDSGALVYRTSDFEAHGLLLGSSHENGVSYLHDLATILLKFRLQWLPA